jgi:hypothetical protein
MGTCGTVSTVRCTLTALPSYHSVLDSDVLYVTYRETGSKDQTDVTHGRIFNNSVLKTFDCLVDKPVSKKTISTEISTKTKEAIVWSRKSSCIRSIDILIYFRKGVP